MQPTSHSKIRVLIAEDESLAREKLSNLLAMDDDLTLVAACRNGREALSEIIALKPDLVFLDIKLPEMDGFSVLEHLQDHLPAGIVFVTAYDRYAVKAFEVNAMDYLLKPFDASRLKKCLAKVKQHLSADQSSAWGTSIKDLMHEFRARSLSQDHGPMVIKSEGKMLFLEAKDIQWIEADDNYVKFHTLSGEHLVRETLLSVEKRLNPSAFVRISRSYIVNISRIREIQPLFHGDSVMILKDGTRLNASRRYRDKFTSVWKKQST